MEELTIKTVAQITQLSEFTLRAWEKRYSVVKPRRASSGYRVYTLADVEKLKLLKALLGTGYPIGQIAKLSFSRLKQLQKGATKKTEGRQQHHVTALLRLLNAFELAAFTAYLRGLQMHFETRVFLIDIVAPFLKQLGTDVYEEKLDLFHEHAASSILKNTLSGILYLTEQSLNPDLTYSLVISTPEKDLHEFGILICAIVAMLNGHRVLYLGPNLPAKSVLKACSASKSKIVLLGMTSPTETNSTAELETYVRELDNGLPRSAKIWLGGPRALELRATKGLAAKRLLVLDHLEAFDQSLKSASEGLAPSSLFFQEL